MLEKCCMIKHLIVQLFDVAFISKSVTFGCSSMSWKFSFDNDTLLKS